MPSVTFIQNGQATTVEAAAGETLLKIALDHQIPLEHACGGNGFCNTCTCKVTKGSEHLSPVNDREEAMGVAEGERLGCQATVSGDVSVEIVNPA